MTVFGEEKRTLGRAEGSEGGAHVVVGYLCRLYRT